MLLHLATQREGSGTIEAGLLMLSSQGLCSESGLICRSERIRASSLLSF